MKIKVLDAHRRPRWVGEGDIIPAGWHFASGERLTEPYRVVRILVEPDEGPSRERLGFEPARLQAERAPVEAANAAGREAAAELNARLQAAGISPAALEFTWHIPITVDGSPVVGRMFASGLAVGIGGRQVEPGDVESIISKARPIQAELDAKRRRKEILEAVKAAGEAAGYPAGKMVKHRGEWVGHDEAFGGLGGGDFADWEEWEWAAWAKRAIARAEKGEDVSAACADEIARAQAADKAASELAAEIRQAVERGLLMVGRWSAQGRMALISGRRLLVEWWPKVPPEAWAEDPRWQVPPEVIKAAPRIRRRIRAAERLARLRQARA
jgi:hypothetical protein